MRVEMILRRKGSRIVAVGMRTTVEAVARLLSAENIGAVVVKDSCGTEGDVVLGVLSERDIVRTLADRGASALRLPVGQLMSRTVIACSPSDELEEVAGLMQKHHIRHVPVVQGGALIGVISIRDLLGLAAEIASVATSPADAALPVHSRQQVSSAELSAVRLDVAERN